MYNMYFDIVLCTFMTSFIVTIIISAIGAVSKNLVINNIAKFLIKLTLVWLSLLIGIFMSEKTQ